MKPYKLNTTQAKILGFTHVFRVVQSDLTVAVNNTVQSITLKALAFGDYVDQIRSYIEILTPGATLATYTVSLGVTGALTQIIGASDCLAAAKTGYAPANSVTSYAVPTGGKNLLATFTPGAAEALASGTNLDILIWVTIREYSDRANGIASLL